MLERTQRRAASGVHRLTRAQPGDEVRGRVRRLVVDELPVDHHYRGVVTGSVALDALQRDGAVRHGLVVADAQLFGQSLEDLVAAHDRAQRVGADTDVVVADRATFVHRVEGRHTGDLGLGQIEELGAQLDTGRCDVPLVRLHQVQHGQQCRPWLRVAGHQLQHLGASLLVELATGRRVLPRGTLAGVTGGPVVGNRLVRIGHRSTPPITGSSEATATTTSETMLPSHMAGTACRLLNDGSRKCARQGRVPPSETTCTPSSPRGASIASYTWPAGTRNPSVTILKWWIKASMDSPMMCLMCSSELPCPSPPMESCAGHAIFLSSTITGPGRSRSMHCSTIFNDCLISSTRMR